jgi:hypothetical protein
VAWLARMGYTCFMEAGADLAPISAPCWHASFERNGWSNVLCAHSDAALRLLRGMVAEGVARRRASVSTASRGRGLRATPPLADVCRRPRGGSYVYTCKSMHLAWTGQRTEH